MNKTQANAVKTLTEARRLISRPQGWMQEGLKEALYTPKGGYVQEKDGTQFYQFCAWGAVEEADGPGERKAKSLLAKAIQVLFGVKKEYTLYTTVYRFNDAKKTRKKDVIAAFDKAIELAQAE